ncbi:DNA polymerase III subunit delta [Beduini massiliensis]|uniref:DNA polymerase III subunit delta n=1 Tax=Beduini massiliensis TaxID=1585974 RepID=UPI000A7A971E|nr:DNA polymerase III subunit delta [Beduini massiliensis]
MVIKMIYVLYGEETFLLEQKLKDIKKEYGISEENMNLAVYDSAATELKEVIEDCNMPPFLSDYKMVLLKNPYFLTTQKGPASLHQDGTLLEKYLKAPMESTIFVIYHNVKNFDERKKLVKLLKKETTFMLMDKIGHHQLKSSVRNAVKRRKAVIDDEALEFMLSRLPNDLMMISSEVEKLCLYSQHITLEDVRAVVSKPLEENAFELVSAIMKKDQQKAVQIYKDLMVNNEEPVKLIVLIANQMRLLMQVKTLDRKGYNDQEIAKILGINPFRLRYIRADASQYDIQDLMHRLNDLALLDTDIKKGMVDKRLGLELFLMKV